MGSLFLLQPSPNNPLALCFLVDTKKTSHLRSNRGGVASPPKAKAYPQPLLLFLYSSTGMGMASVSQPRTRMPHSNPCEVVNTRGGRGRHLGSPGRALVDLRSRSPWSSSIRVSGSCRCRSLSPPTPTVMVFGNLGGGEKEPHHGWAGLEKKEGTGKGNRGFEASGRR